MTRSIRDRKTLLLTKENQIPDPSETTEMLSQMRVLKNKYT